MAWIEGKQIVRNDSIEINEEIKSLEGYLEEDEARYWFIQFLKNNISFFARKCLGQKYRRRGFATALSKKKYH